MGFHLNAGFGELHFVRQAAKGLPGRSKGRTISTAKNALGDIDGIFDTDMNLIGEYVYDAWGNCVMGLRERTT